MATSKKPDKLADLTASLAARKATPATVTPAPAPAPAAPVVAVRSPALDALVPNQSFSVYESDLDVLERIRGWLAARGVRSCNASEAVRLCIRLAGVESNADALADLCRAARAKDGRKTRWKQHDQVALL